MNGDTPYGQGPLDRCLGHWWRCWRSRMGLRCLRSLGKAARAEEEDASGVGGAGPETPDLLQSVSGSRPGWWIRTSMARLSMSSGGMRRAPARSSCAGASHLQAHAAESGCSLVLSLLDVWRAGADAAWKHWKRKKKFTYLPVSAVLSFNSCAIVTKQICPAFKILQGWIQVMLGHVQRWSSLYMETGFELGCAVSYLMV
ncbi:uncharacterized protein LOC119340397 isoform X2 [Triticum dicoccoides]|uniref:uncharacterized protein LOC119340397 isoform X2 n=1 Tax=Triticum dicoccoides TaxID=85692 RepID=UPI001890F714|nr:uncharacterized protein LOC119340397 isoform X2 [Triticum dicoccoides]